MRTENEAKEIKLRKSKKEIPPKQRLELWASRIHRLVMRAADVNPYTTWDFNV